MQHGQHVGAFGRAERPSGSGPIRGQSDLGRRRCGRAKDGTLPIEGSTGHPEDIAGGKHANRKGQMGNGVHQGFSSGSAFGRGHPNSAPTFF